MNKQRHRPRQRKREQASEREGENRTETKIIKILGRDTWWTFLDVGTCIMRVLCCLSQYSKTVPRRTLHCGRKVRVGLRFIDTADAVCVRSSDKQICPCEIPCDRVFELRHACQ